MHGPTLYFSAAGKSSSVTVAFDGFRRLLTIRPVRKESRINPYGLNGQRLDESVMLVGYLALFSNRLIVEFRAIARQGQFVWRDAKFGAGISIA